MKSGKAETVKKRSYLQFTNVASNGFLACKLQMGMGIHPKLKAGSCSPSLPHSLTQRQTEPQVSPGQGNKTAPQTRHPAPVRHPATPPVPRIAPFQSETDAREGGWAKQHSGSPVQWCPAAATAHCLVTPHNTLPLPLHTHTHTHLETA